MPGEDGRLVIRAKLDRQDRSTDAAVDQTEWPVAITEHENDLRLEKNTAVASSSAGGDCSSTRDGIASSPSQGGLKLDAVGLRQMGVR